MVLNAPRHRPCALDLMVHRTYAVMAALYLKGVAPPHVTLNQIFGGVMPFMAIQLLRAAVSPPADRAVAAADAVRLEGADVTKPMLAAGPRATGARPKKAPGGSPRRPPKPPLPPARRFPGRHRKPPTLPPRRSFP